MTNLWWTILLSVVGLTGYWIAGNKKQLGWLIGIWMQALWITFAIVTDQFGFILSAMGFGFVNARNYLKWRREQAQSGNKGEGSSGV